MTPKNKLLIVVDVQNDFVTGSLGTAEAKAVVPNIMKKVEQYRKRDNVIIFTKDTHYDDYLDTLEGQNLPIKHCIKDTEGWEVVRELDAKCSVTEKIYIKDTFGYKWNTLPWIDCHDIEIVGICTDICVITNALVLKTHYPETQITVDASCCAGTTPERHKAALEVMKSCQINVVGE